MSTISVRKRNNSWEYRLYFGRVDGKPIRKSKSGFRTKKEAREAAEQAAQDYEDSKPTIPNSPTNMTFGQYLDFWIDNYCRVNLKETSIYDYSKRIDAIIKPRIGSVKLSSLTPMILQGFINDVFNAGYSRHQLGCIKGILTCSLRYAVAPAGFIADNPAAPIKLPLSRARPKTPSRKKVREPITIEQWQQIMERFPREHPSHIPLNLGFHLGLRLGEAFGLCWEDVDFEHGVVSVKRQVQYDNNRKCWYFTEPKYDSHRTISIDDELLTLLKDEQQRQQRAKAYFSKRYQQVFMDDEQHFSNCGKEINLICVRENGSYIQPRTTQHMNHIIHSELGMPLFDFHTLRHTHATMLIEAGASLLDIKERLGHTKIDITEIYTHNTDKTRARTTRILNSIFANSGK